MTALTPDERLMFEEFIEQYDFCWACGWTYGNSRMDPSLDGKNCDWLERHHISKIRRVHARYNISSLCRLCHDLAEGLIHRDKYGRQIPNLTPSNVLWLKKIHDPANYNRKLLATHWRGLVPRAIKPPRWFELQQKRKYRHRWPIDRFCT